MVNDTNNPLPDSRIRAALDILGLSARAGAVVSGTQAVRTAARDGKVRQAVLAADAAEGQRQKLIPLLEARRISYYTGFTQDELGAAIGRAPVSAIGLTNDKLAARIRVILNG